MNPEMNVEVRAEETKFLALPPEVHELIIEKLDNKSKRALRSTCVKMRDCLNQLPCMDYTISYTCLLEEVDLADGQKRYDMIHYANRDEMDLIVARQSFATVEEMNNCLQKALKKIDTLKELVLKVTGFSEPIQLVKNRRELKVRTLYFDMNSNQMVVDGFLNQFDARVMVHFILSGTNLGERVFGALEVRDIRIYARVNDAQLLNIRAPSVTLYDGGDLTVAGLKDFFKKMLREGETWDFCWKNATVEQLNSIGFGQRRRRDAFLIDPTYCDNTLFFAIIHDPPLPTEIFAVLHPRTDEAFRARPAEMSPALQNFIHSVELDL